MADAAPSPGSDLLAAAMDQGLAAGCALLFGGQGYLYFEELQALWADEGSHAVLTAIAAALAEELASAEGVKAAAWPLGLDLVGWLESPADRPSIPYLCSAPVSYPLVFACQLANYVVTLQRTGCAHADFIPTVKGATGHSQGVVAAAVVASAATDADLITRAALGAKYMLWQGTRCHEVLNASVRYTGTTPQSSPMLAVTGLGEAALRKVSVLCSCSTHGLPSSTMGLITSGCVQIRWWTR